MKKGSKKQRKRSERRISNRKIPDSGGKIVFGNATLCSQLLRNYTDMDMLKDIRPEYIEDVTERFVPMFTEEREADVIKQIHIPGGEDINNLVDCIKERKPMGLFDNWEGFDVQKEQKIGERRGEKKGEKNGERKTMIELVCKKLQSGKSAKTIAKEIERSESFSRKVIKVARKYYPDYDVQKIFDELYPSKAK